MFRNLLDDPRLYLFFQMLIGGRRSRKVCIQQYLSIAKGSRVLDIGCGPGFVASFLPQSTYVGYDVDRKYIDYARRHYGSLGLFNYGEYNRRELERYPPFDFVMMNGLLHHLDNATSLGLLKLAFDSLQPGGKVLCIDGCFRREQSAFAKYLLTKDRGKFVRDLDGYRQLGAEIFGQTNVKTYLREDLLYIPYSLVIMVLLKS